jgi:hypothetical protein
MARASALRRGSACWVVFIGTTSTTFKLRVVT